MAVESATLPAGMREAICHGCGARIWLASLGAAAAAKIGVRPGWTFLLEPGPSRGNIAIIDGEVHFVGTDAAPYSSHNCVGRVRACKQCGRKVRVAHQPPEVPVRVAVLDAEPDPTSVVVIDGRGFAVRDPSMKMEGPRYRWHVHRPPEA